MNHKLYARLASAYHDAWREEYTRDFDGFRPSRIESTSDRQWVKLHGSSAVDLINTAFKELPKDWQMENIAAAETALSIISELGTGIDLQNSIISDLVGKKVHDAWLKRQNNSEDSSLNIPYEKLTLEEKEKDIRQVEIALRLSLAE